MTKSQIVFAMEAIHGYGMTLQEVADLCGCYYRDLERINKEIMTYLSVHDRINNVLIVEESKINSKLK